MPNLANIITVYDTNGWLNTLRNTTICCDGDDVLQISSDEFNWLVIPPGGYVEIIAG